MNNGMYHRPRHTKSIRRLCGWLGAVVLVAASALPARASSIHHQGNALQAWANYLNAGQGVWSSVHNPPVTPQVRAAIFAGLNSSDPTSDPLVDYLLWRRALDPARFDRWHPIIGPQLGQLTTPTQTVTSITPTGTTSTVTTTSTTPQPQGQVPPTTTGGTTNPRPSAGGVTVNPLPGPPPIPEPNTAVIALMLIGSGAWWRWRSGGRNAGTPVG